MIHKPQSLKKKLYPIYSKIKKNWALKKYFLWKNMIVDSAIELEDGRVILVECKFVLTGVTPVTLRSKSKGFLLKNCMNFTQNVTEFQDANIFKKRKLS
jgi:hypothetical protein